MASTACCQLKKKEVKKEEAKKRKKGREEEGENEEEEAKNKNRNNKKKNPVRKLSLQPQIEVKSGGGGLAPEFDWCVDRSSQT